MAEPVDFSPLSNRAEDRLAVKSKEWQAIVPVPEDAPALPRLGPKGKEPHCRYVYRDADGRLLGVVLRFEGQDGDKTFLPLVFACHLQSQARAWRWQSWDEPRPLYGLDRLAAAPQAPVIVAEGEKATDAIGRMMPDYIAVTSPGGSKAAGKADWSVLRGRNVILWPDRDQAGRGYVEHVAKILRLMGVTPTVIEPPAGKDDGWDAADAESSAWSPSQIEALIADASARLSSENAKAAAADNEGGQGRRRGGSQILDALGDVELWHDTDRRAYASVPVGAHFENVAIGTKAFRNWLVGRLLDKTGTVPGREAREDACMVLEARAIHQGEQNPVWRRVARRGEAIYLDLGDDLWRAVEVTVAGWRIVERPPVKFLRSAASRSLPVPEPCEDGLERELTPFINTESSSEFKLICSWLVAAFHPAGPFTILAVSGEQGSGKSNLCRMLRTLTDPNASPIRAAPEQLRDLVVTADNGWMLCYDNISSIPAWLSDALCRISTGSGFSTRELHTDRDEAVFYGSRPALLNGIPDLAARPDLQDRTIGIVLPAIPEDRRRPESDVWRDFEEALPRILGGLLDGVAASLRNLSTVRLDKLPRMADFARIAVAAAPGLGWSGDEFVAAYANSRAAAVSLSIEASLLGQMLQRFAEGYSGEAWEGTAADLLVKLNGLADDLTRKARNWPKTAADLGSQVRRLIPPLRALGVTIEQRRLTDRARTRVMSIQRSPAPPA
jgi:hypothetical protein